MTFLRGVADLSLEEGQLYYYWLTMVTLLKEGIPWEALVEFTSDEISLIMGINAAIHQQENDEQMKNMAKTNVPLSSMGGF
jgi:hypothetical protein|tara:strand:- start:2242 stop:2484 length:243 start_codon:yes stop_codon:yes gene_type:complete